MASTTASIHRTLNLIVPTTTTLSPILIDLATTLLAQSRAKVPSLKPDEEIARPFACCHIACERLKHRLALEIGKVGPPCGPRIYKRLYAFLESSLGAEVSTPRGRRVIDVDVGATPASVRSGRLGNASGVKATPGSLGKRNRAAVELDSGASNLPQWTMPMIRHICEACDTPRTATHVYAGVESIYRALQSAAQKAEAGEAATPSKRRRSNGGDVDKVTSDIPPMPTDEQIPALIIAVYLVTAEAMQGQARPAANKSRQRKAQSAAEVFLITQENTAIEIKPKDIETYLQAAKQGWTDMEWYKNLRSTNDDDNDNGTDRGADYDELSGPNTPRRRPAKTPLRRKEKHSQRKIGEEEQNPAGLLPGLGTMFQPAVDWLSEERRAEFEEWKEDLLGGVALVEQEA
jgi:origin recognition complex subunit 6